MQIEERFFHLLQIAVGQKFNDSIDLSKEEWDAIYELASKQSLVSVILHAIDKLNSTSKNLPKCLLLQWIGESEQIRQRNNYVNQLCAQLSSWFKGRGISCCILKGQGVAQLYIHPETRQSGDIDIWVDGNRDEVVRKMLDQSIDVSYVDYVNCHAGFFTDAEVEVHFRPTWFYNPFVNRRAQKWIEHNKSFQITNYDNNVGFCYPTIGFNLVFSLIHIYRHIFQEGIGLRQLLDYYYILIHSSTEERSEALVTLKSFGLGKFVAAVMFIERKVFNIDESYTLCSPNVTEGNFLLEEILLGGNFGHYDDRNSFETNENRWKRGYNNIKRNFRYLKRYPSEVIWMPMWKVWHWAWRLWKGYLD